MSSRPKFPPAGYAVRVDGRGWRAWQDGTAWRAPWRASYREALADALERADVVRRAAAGG